MKRKFIMGSFALLFAASAAFATTSRVLQPAYYWDDEVDKNECISFETTLDCSPGPQTCIDQNTPDGARNLYDDPNCRVTLQPQQGF